MHGSRQTHTSSEYRSLRQNTPTHRSASVHSKRTNSNVTWRRMTVSDSYLGLCASHPRGCTASGSSANSKQGTG